jgi:hypothetical protein
MTTGDQGRFQLIDHANLRMQGKDFMSLYCRGEWGASEKKDVRNDDQSRNVIENTRRAFSDPMEHNRSAPISDVREKRMLHFDDRSLNVIENKGQAQNGSVRSAVVGQLSREP